MSDDSPPPPSRFGGLALAAAIVGGALVGLGAFAFGYGDGASYLSDDPAACANCHVMQGHLESWQRSGHRHVATCNDCHLSQHPIGRWLVKADNGFFHSLAFTTGDFPDPIRIKPRNRRVAHEACLHCHGDFVHALLPERSDAAGDRLVCAHCHSDAGHAHR